VLVEGSAGGAGGADVLSWKSVEVGAADRPPTRTHAHSVTVASVPEPCRASPAPPDDGPPAVKISGTGGSITRDVNGSPCVKCANAAGDARSAVRPST